MCAPCCVLTSSAAWYETDDVSNPRASLPVSSRGKHQCVCPSTTLVRARKRDGCGEGAAREILQSRERKRLV